MQSTESNKAQLNKTKPQQNLRRKAKHEEGAKLSRPQTLRKAQICLDLKHGGSRKWFRLTKKETLLWQHRQIVRRRLRQIDNMQPHRRGLENHYG